jgi:hypothetical protein
MVWWVNGRIFLLEKFGLDYRPNASKIPPQEMT